MFQLSLCQLTGATICSSILLLQVAACLAGTLPIQFAPPATHATAGTSAGAVAADFNGDGNPDLAAAVSGSVQVLVGNGDGTFQPAVSYPAASSMSTVMRAADFNGDGRPDLALIRSTSSLVSVLLNNGDGTFQAKVDYAIGGDVPMALVTADLNGDGRIDLAIANEGNSFACIPEVSCPPPPPDYLNSANVTVLMGNGDGTFQPATANTINGRAEGLAVLDASGDGLPDLAAVNSTQMRVSLLYGLGNGQFQSALGSVTYSSQSTGTLRAADLNRDGIADLFMSDSNGQAAIYLGSGNGQYQAPRYASAGTRSEAYDLDGDGIPDLIGTWNGYFNVMLGVGDGSFLPAEMYTIGGNLTGAAVADFDRDGLPDLAFANSTASGVTVLLNRGVKMASPSAASFTGMNLNVASSPKYFTITNSLGRPLAVSAIGVTGADSAMFSVSPGGPVPCATLTPTLAPGESCTIQSVFTPTLYNSRSASIDILSDHTMTPVYTIALTGHANPSPLTINWAGSSTGIIIVPPSQSYTSGPRTFYYFSIDTVTLQATPTAPTGAVSWSGCDVVDGTQCTVTMNMPRTVTATFDTVLPVILPVFLESTASYFQTVGAACSSAGDTASIAVVIGSYTEQLQLSRPGTLRLRGGCDSSFAACTGVSTLVGALTIDAGDVTLENFQLSSGALSINSGSLVASNVAIL